MVVEVEVDFFFLLLAIFELTLSMTPPNTASGKRFVFAIPIANRSGKTGRNDSAWVRFNTEEEQAVIVLSFPLNRTDLSTRNRKYRDIKCTVSRGKPCTYNVSSERLTPNLTDTGMFLAIKVKADAPVSGVLYVTTSSGQGSTIIRLLPQEICSTSYYVSTTNGGFPFIMVMAFDSKVKAVVIFPKYKKDFKVPCSGNKLCSGDSTVAFSLHPFRVWQLYIELEGATLHNTVIKASRPVYVVAGNTALKDRKDSIDTGAFSLRPTDTWGKQYVIPKFGPDKNPASLTSYRINSKKIPFDYKLFQHRKVHKKTITNYESDEIIREFTSPVVVSADAPFGLYQYVGGDGLEVGFLNLVPTEQWTNGGSYLLGDERHPPGMKVSYKRLIFTTSDKKTIVASGDSSVAWQPSIHYSGRTYSYGILKVGSFPNSVYSTQPNGRLVIYKAMLSTKGRPNAYYSMSSYFSKIYEPGCTKTDPFFNDGIDNDCDGFVDEEFENKKDDDGDGLIDEDYMETPEKPQWTAWTTVCRMNCDGKNYEKKVRDCKVNFLTEFTCDGKRVTCDSGHRCRSFCRKAITSQCQCPVGCKTCGSPSVHRCSECRDGYHGNHCTIPCPDGWKGRHCSVPPRPDDLPPFGTTKARRSKKERRPDSRHRATRKDDPDDPDDTWLWVVILLLGLAGLLVVCSVRMARDRKRRWTRDALPGARSELFESTQADDQEEINPDEGSGSGGVSAKDVSARDVSAKDVSARDVSASDVSASDVSARDVPASDSISKLESEVDLK